MTRILLESGRNFEAERRRAKDACFRECKSGAFIDPENGCFSPCKSADRCTGWIPFLDVCKKVNGRVLRGKG